MTTSNATTELGQERTRAAAERTLTSWIQSCFTLIAFGFGFERIADAWNRAFPGKDQAAYHKVAPYVALITIGLALLLLGLAIVDFLRQTRRSRPAGNVASIVSPFATAGIILFAAVAVGAVFILAK